ncbi:MAG: DUF4153 domain-containing protein [Roseiflexaceae bacterium]
MESSNKLVVEERLKGSGMDWVEQNVKTMRASISPITCSTAAGWASRCHCSWRSALRRCGGLAAPRGRPPTRANLWLGAVALFFALCVALRDAPFLIALDLLATLGLLLLLAANYRGAALARLPGGRVLTRAAIATAEISLRPMPLALQSLGSVRITTEQTRRLVPVGRGLALAAPVLIVFTGLLMAADSVFVSYVIQAFSLELPFDPSVILAHATIAGIVAWLYAGGALTVLSHAAPAFPQQHIKV